MYFISDDIKGGNKIEISSYIRGKKRVYKLQEALRNLEKLFKKSKKKSLKIFVKEIDGYQSIQTCVGSIRSAISSCEFPFEVHLEEGGEVVIYTIKK